MTKVHPPQKPRQVIWLGLLLTIMLSHTVAAGPTLGQPVLGGRMLVANDGYVTAEFLGSDAGYFNSLYLDMPDAEDRFVFNKSTPLDLGPVDLGWFSAGTELIFRLAVHNTGLSFFTGDADRNDDGLAHALATTVLDDAGTYITTVGFEDLFGGGDLDFNDFEFHLTNVIDPVLVSAPPVLALLALGLLGLGYQRRWNSGSTALA
ncbi:MAG: DUF4114 domain-containing protein [Sedimenticolaceae bacterium]